MTSTLDISWTFGGQSLAAAAAMMEKAATSIQPYVARAMSDVGDDAVKHILTLTPAPGVQEVPRTWVRTGALARSIVSDVTTSAGDTTLQISTDKPYAYRWIELGFRRGRGGGTVYMKARPGGYRMFEQGRAYLAGPVMRDALGKAVRRAWGR